MVWFRSNEEVEEDQLDQDLRRWEEAELDDPIARHGYPEGPDEGNQALEDYYYAEFMDREHQDWLRQQAEDERRREQQSRNDIDTGVPGHGLTVNYGYRD